MRDEFVGEPLKAVGALEGGRSPIGAPLLPGSFEWRGRRYAVTEVLRRWKSTSQCTSGSDEQYVRKHWFRVRTSDGTEMELYFERQARSRRDRARRWWLYTVAYPDAQEGSEDEANGAAD